MDPTPFITAAISATSAVAMKQIIEGVKQIVNRNIERTTLCSTEEELEQNIMDEIRKTSNWALDDLFKNHNEHSDVYSRYVHLDLLLEPRRDHFDNSQLLRKRPLKEVVSENNGNIVILGQPGSGKTTSVKYLVNSILRDPDFLNGIYRIPIVIRLRELNKSNSVLNELQEGGIFEKLSMILGLKFEIDYIIKKVKKKELNESPIDSTKADNEKLKTLLKTKVIPYILDSQRILLILDGYDEIMDDSIKKLVIAEIKELTNSLNDVHFILTSRSADYKLLLENTNVYEISELTSGQIKEFSEKWFENAVLSDSFLKELYSKTPYEDFYTRPLLLTQLALIYTRTNEIPNKPKMIYQRIVELVLKEWNENQGLKRKSKYSSFTVERKREFLAAMAFHLTLKYKSRVFTRDQLADIYINLTKKFSELPGSEIVEVVEEIETHNGLIIKSGHDNFEFSHLTIQEYFVADYIVRTSNIRKFKYYDLIKIPNELALAVALSSEPYMYLLDILEAISKGRITQDFLTKFFNRIKLENPDFESDSLILIALLMAYTKICNDYRELWRSRFRMANYLSKESKLIEDRLILEDIIDDLSKGDVKEVLAGYYSVRKDRTQISDLSLDVFDKLFTAEERLGNHGIPKLLYWKN